eukprot:snap_masked-scaffold_90-processed-gene-0.3-mRNA-1 protein AED:1.00 eAED:1.00 QI:0/0/0/0/1/1/2/0/96
MFPPIKTDQLRTVPVMFKNYKRLLVDVVKFKLTKQEKLLELMSFYINVPADFLPRSINYECCLHLGGLLTLDPFILKSELLIYICYSIYNYFVNFR